MYTLEEYLKNADDLAANVINGWAASINAGNKKFITDEYKVLFDRACDYRTAKNQVENQRQFKSLLGDSEFNTLIEPAVTHEKQTRETFAKTYQEFREKHDGFGKTVAS